MMVALYEPEIPPNTGNIARLCAGFDIHLNLIEPLGFSLESRYLKRAGLDYWPHVKLPVWRSFEDFRLNMPDRLVMATTRAQMPVQDFRFSENDILLFGPETRGLPDSVLALSACQIRIPVRAMSVGGVRSLNLSSACAIILYAALADCGLLGRFS